MKRKISAVLAAAAENRVLVYGHRGARSYAPMNTLASFELAIRQGADGVELDVQLSADGKLVVIHDFSVDGTTDGSGAVRDLSFSALRELNAAARFKPAAVPLDGRVPGPFAFSAIPTLDEVFVLVRDTAGPDFIVNVEIKAPFCRADGGEEPAARDGIEAAVAACVARHGMARQVIVSSFNPPTLNRLRAAAPDLPRGFLEADDAPLATAPLMAAIPHQAWHPCASLVTPETAGARRRQGTGVNVWTVNEAAEALRLIGCGATGIITDVPDRILQAVNRSLPCRL